MSPSALTWLIAALATAGVIIRPFNWPEAIFAVGGAALLVAFGLLSPADALAGAGKGTDVYLFLTGMMLLSEIARQEGLFDWSAAIAARRARGSASRLFTLIYVVGTIVTIFLSNDATAVVLTPAVAAVARTAKARNPLPYLLVCAFVANAASFVLPISNPANLVIYAGQMPPLLQWVPRFAFPSIAAIVGTFLILRWTQRAELNGAIDSSMPTPVLSRGGRIAAAGVCATAIILLAASALDRELGLPTAIAGAVTTVIVLASEGRSPLRTLQGISWGVLPLVAGLFMLVEALSGTGLLRILSDWLQAGAGRSATGTLWAAGVVTAFAGNLVNNLPAGLIAASAVQGATLPDAVTSAILIGIDLGPNLSVTGSLATILWLTALRREGQHVGAVAFLKIGVLVMLPTLLLSLAALEINRLF